MEGGREGRRERARDGRREREGDEQKEKDKWLCVCDVGALCGGHPLYKATAAPWPRLHTADAHGNAPSLPIKAAGLCERVQTL